MNNPDGDRSFSEDSFDFFNRKLKKTAVDIVKYLPTLIAIVTVATIVMTVWVEVSVAELFSVNFAMNMVLYLAMFFVVYYSLAENGTRAGERDAGYTEASQKHAELCDRLRAGGMIAFLGGYCDSFVTRELEDVRKAILAEASVSYESFRDEYLPLAGEIRYGITGSLLDKSLKNGRASPCNEEILRKFSALPLSKKKAIIRAVEKKAISLTPEKLLAGKKAQRARNPLAPTVEKSRKKRDRMNLVPLVVLTFVSVSVVISLAENLTFVNFIYGMVKAMTALWIGFKGYSSHYLVYAVDAVAFHNSQLNVLSGFERYCSECLEARKPE